MSDVFHIRPTPAERHFAVLELLFRSLHRDERAAQMATTAAALRSGKLTIDGLFEAARDNQLVGVVWASRGTGRTALVWPPQIVESEDEATSRALLAHVDDWMRGQGLNIANAFLSGDDSRDAQRLVAAGYQRGGEILFLVSQRSAGPSEVLAGELEFLAYDEAQHDRLIKILDATYEGTLDCPQLNGRQSTKDVLAGYRETGVYSPDLWQIARQGQDDVGCLLLADHPAEDQFELVYQGVAPAARGRGLGMLMTRQAQWLAAQAGRERLVLAVDAGNRPALKIYREAGFTQWDRRFLLLKILDETAP